MAGILLKCIFRTHVLKEEEGKKKIKLRQQLLSAARSSSSRGSEPTAKPEVHQVGV